MGPLTFCEFVQPFNPKVPRRLKKIHRVTGRLDMYDYSPLRPTIGVPIIALSRVVVELNVILFYTLPVSYEAVTAQSPTEHSARQPQAAGVGLAHACTPAAMHALKVTKPS